MKRSTAILLVLAIVALLVVNSADFFFHTPFYETWDSAANALSVDRAKHFAQLYGPYSRWGDSTIPARPSSICRRWVNGSCSIPCT